MTATMTVNTGTLPCAVEVQMAMANGQDDSNNTEILIIHANLLNITNTFRQKSFETVCKIEKKMLFDL